MYPEYIQYLYLRGLQLEGRYPDDAGIWGLTLCRMQFGEGLPFEDHKDFKVPVCTPGVLPNVPRIPPRDTRSECFLGYHKVTDSKSAAKLLNARPLAVVMAAIPLSSSWIDNTTGIIEVPHPGAALYEQTHGVTLCDADESKASFGFPNTWGTGWGKDGWGELPFEYIDRYAFENYALDPEGPVEFRFHNSVRRSFKGTAYCITVTELLLEDSSRQYNLCLTLSPKVRYGWAFVREYEGVLDVQELFIRPEFRGKGFSNLLLDGILGIRRQRGLRGAHGIRLGGPDALCTRSFIQILGKAVAVIRKF